MQRSDPVISTVSIEKLRPTQMTVGMREVGRKRAEWAEKKPRDRDSFLKNRLVPCVLGPGKLFYITDHHHMTRALHDEDVDGVFVLVQARLSHLDEEEFWTYLQYRGWCHPYDADGHRRPPDDIPVHVGELVDDPYRSLAGELRHSGGYAKDSSAFAEFQWADYLRRRVKRKKLERNFDKALARALELAREKDARHLPGWCSDIE